MLDADSKPKAETMVTVAEETAVDYALTARLATEAFADDAVAFSPERMQWLYEKGFGQGATVLAALHDGRKIGQIALLDQTLCIAGDMRPAVQLVDLFVAQAHRSAGLVRKLYQEVERICEQRGVRYMLALPNDKSAALNARLLKLTAAAKLPVRAGVSLLQCGAKLNCDDRIKALSHDQAVALLSPFTQRTTENGVHYDADSLRGRLDDPTRDYAVHATDALLLISTRRQRKHVSYTVLCGLFPRPQARLFPQTVDELVRAACGFWNSPLFVYAGMNRSLPKLPGQPLPFWLKRPILVQLRDLAGATPGTRLDRFELVDSDFA